MLGAAAALYAAFVLRGSFEADGTRYFVLFDDAMISMQFAKNFASGHGLVLNTGELPVEGYTNLLWTLLLSGIHRSGVPTPLTSLAVSLIGALILLANVALVWRIARRVFPAEQDAPIAGLSAASVAFCYPLAYWTLRGFEVGLIALLVDALVLSVLRFESAGRLRDALAIQALIGGLVLSRSDAVLPCAVVIVYLVATRSIPAARWLALGSCLTLFGVLAAHTLFRVSYYGDPLPNTYYLKLAGVELIRRLERGLLMLALVVLRNLHLTLCGLLGLGIACPEIARERRVLLLAGLGGLTLLYSVYVGGDAWERLGFANRFIAIGLPPLLVLSSAGWFRLAQAVSGGQKHGLQATLQAAFYVGALVSLVAGVAAVVSERRLPYSSLFPGLRFYLGGAGLGLSLLLALGARRLSHWISARAAWPSKFLCSGLAPSAPRPQTLALTLGLGLVLSAGEWAKWAIYGSELSADDATATRIALRLKANTLPGTSVALCRLGAISYFSDRRAIDLLGKNDPVVAHGEPRLRRFVPGHNKWNLHHSIGKLRPDVILDLPTEVTESEIAYIKSLGYAKDPDLGWYHR